MDGAAQADTLVVASLSARVLAESAAQGGWRVVALDLFGDLDTRSAAVDWLPIGSPHAGGIDGPALCQALATAAQRAGTIGWVAGSGFEAAPEGLDAAPPGLPLLGMASAAVRAVRDPRHFFATLTRLGLVFPPTRFDKPADATDWLVKRSAGSGGWHIRRVAQPHTPHADSYYQRALAGVPMSALFLADGQGARLVALNRLIVRPLGALPHIYRGAIGPIADAALQARIDTALAALVPAFALRGLVSLDFIAVGGEPHLLEINPRPSASMALHALAWPQGLMRAHVLAMQGTLPPPPQHAPGVRGTEIVLARRRGIITADTSATLAALPFCHDLPADGTTFEAGDPLCSVSAEGVDADSVQAALHAHRSRIRDLVNPRDTEPLEHAT